MKMCERCKTAPATAHMEYRESSDESHWKNQVTARCASCAQSLREYVVVVSGFILLVDRPLDNNKEVSP